MGSKGIKLANGIGLIVNPQKKEAVDYAAILVKAAEKYGWPCYIPDKEVADAIRLSHNYMHPEELIKKIGIALSLGGDGTLLNTARFFAKSLIPILGINFGRFGFLTGTAPQNPEDILTTVENGNFEIEDRMAIECFLSNGISSVALNDVVVSREAIARLIEIEVNINDEYLTTYVADGLIIATPTGSTAHSLSAGGPIVSPNAKGILLTPLCPHTLTNRPLIVDPTSVIRISLKSSTKDGLITIDGQQVYTVNQNDCVIIKVAPHPIKLVTLRARSYYEILRQKLNWGER
ncbi:NAD(+)/NADH kinase [bacterium]|nr:NAD(+)/NADH kinase [bacterium]